MKTEQYAGRYNTLAGRILMHCSAEHPGGNVFVSPFSILMLLSIAARSAAGTTREEIVNFLNSYPGQDIACAALDELQQQLSGGKALSSANAVCVRQDFARTVNEKYAGQVLRSCGGHLFTSGNMREDVDRWVEEKTRGMIKNAMPESMDGALFCLLNAIAFEAAWESQVEDQDVRDRVFYNADGTRSHVQMLCTTENLYIEDDRFTGFVKPYEGNEYGFMALLPKRKADLPASLKKIDFPGLYRAADWNAVHVCLPEFSFDFSQNLKAFCVKEGITEIWSPDADFSPLSGAWLKMDGMLHHACIDVSRTETRAAALTIGEIAFGGILPRDFKEVNLNRPFIFAVVHSRTGLPVFTGIVNHL